MSDKEPLFDILENRLNKDDILTNYGNQLEPMIQRFGYDEIKKNKNVNQP